MQFGAFIWNDKETEGTQTKCRSIILRSVNREKLTRKQIR